MASGERDDFMETALVRREAGWSDPHPKGTTVQPNESATCNASPLEPTVPSRYRTYLVNVVAVTWFPVPAPAAVYERSKMPLSVNIVIPTYQRSALVRSAVRTAMEQSHARTIVTVIDDGSTDDTCDVLSDWFTDPRFNYVQLARNLGTAQAKNVGIALNGCDAVTFHDSDDRPHPDKVLMQVRKLATPGIEASPVFDWSPFGIEPGSSLSLAAVLTEHELIRANGSRFHVRRTLSLAEDFLPNLQMAVGPPGDWILVNSGLFHASVFERLGGFEDCIEEDRELRNRLVMAGEAIWVIPHVLLTKIECADSLTAEAGTGYDSPRRARDRALVRQRVADWVSHRKVPTVPLALPDLDIAFVSNPAHLVRSSVPADDGTEARLGDVLARWRPDGS